MYVLVNVFVFTIIIVLGIAVAFQIRVISVYVARRPADSFQHHSCFRRRRCPALLFTRLVFARSPAHVLRRCVYSESRVECGASDDFEAGVELEGVAASEAILRRLFARARRARHSV